MTVSNLPDPTPAPAIPDPIIPDPARPELVVPVLPPLDGAARLPSPSLSNDELQVLNAVSADLEAAFGVLAPYRHRAKIAVFGSARLKEDSVAYRQARDLAVMFARAGFVSVTGGGPGIMTAGLRGAGPGNAVGVAIELPFESPVVDVGVPVVLQRRFHTRKLALMRRMRGFVCAAGGFGTLDELFEVLTLVQTMHKDPTPIVLIEDGTGMFESVMHAVAAMDRAELISPNDSRLVVTVDSAQAAFDHICQFFRRYRGITSTHEGQVLELVDPVGADECAELVADGFPVELHPVGVATTRRLDAGTLRLLIDELNRRSTLPLPPDLGFELSVGPTS